MNFNNNFSNRKLFSGTSQGTTRSIDMNRFKERTGARTVDEVRMSRIKLKDQLESNIYGPKKMRELNKTEQQVVQNNTNNTTNTERRFNHVEAVRNIKRGI